MDAASVEQSAGDRAGVTRAAQVIVAGGVVFMIPVIFFPGIHANFAEEGVDRLSELAPHYTNFLIGSALLSVGWLLMGIGLFLLCRGLSDLEVGPTSDRLRTLGKVLLGALSVIALIYLVPQGWFMTAAEYVEQSDKGDPIWLLVIQGSAVVTTLASWLYMARLLARSDRWPTWLGITFGVFGLLTMVTQLPLFAAIGAIVLGVTVRKRSRVEAVAAPSAA